MNLPIDPDLTPIPEAQPAPLDIDEAIEALTQPLVVDTTIYTQIRERRSQLEDPETLRGARAL